MSTENLDARRLRGDAVTNAAALADQVVVAARTHTIAVAGEATAALIVDQLAADLKSVNDRSFASTVRTIRSTEV